MKSLTFIAAVAVFAAGSAFAADAPVASATAVTAAAGSITATHLNVPVLISTTPSTRSRAEVCAEAVEAAKNAKTTFAAQLEQSKN